MRKKIGDIRGQLPAGLQGPFFNDEFGDVYGVMFAFSTDGFTYRELKDYVERARQDLLRVPNVAKVDLFGVQDEKIYIEISHRRLAQLGLDIGQLAQQLNAQNAVEGAGVVVLPTDNVQVRITGEFRAVEDLRQLPIRANGLTYKLGDVATITRGYIDPPRDKMRAGRRGEAGHEVIGLGVIDGEGRRHHRARQGAGARPSAGSRRSCRSASTWRRSPTSRARCRPPSTSSCACWPRRSSSCSPCPSSASACTRGRCASTCVPASSFC